MTNKLAPGGSSANWRIGLPTLGPCIGEAKCLIMLC